MNTDRLFCGLAVPFDEPSIDGELRWEREAFERFAELEMALPVRLNHEGIVTSSRMLLDIGAARRFALLEETSFHPAGLLALGELDVSPAGDGLLDGISRREITGLSLSLDIMWPDDDPVAWPTELSICHDPRFDSARIAGVGAEALRVWELLTESAGVRA